MPGGQGGVTQTMPTIGTVRLNIGCGDYRMREVGWVNVDAAEDSQADLKLSVPPLPWASESVSEIYAGHFLEHLDRPVAAEFLMESWRVLRPGGVLGVMVPDTREVMRRYVLREDARMEFPNGNHLDLRDLDNLCAALLFSTLQPSHHRWAWDAETLGRALRYAGFDIVGEIDRYSDPRVAVGAWYQLGLEARKP
jgi:predicted SAM-dependent methyltransferase